MSAARTARLELRLTPAQKEILARGAALRGKTMTEYSLEVLLAAALRDASVGVPTSLGWMQGTATITGDVVGSTDAEGWEPGELPG